jgi:hypothetical protein
MKRHTQGDTLTKNKITHEKWECTEAEKKKYKPEQITRIETMRYLWEQKHFVLPHRTTAPFVQNVGYVQFNRYYATQGEPDLLVFAHHTPMLPIWIELKKKNKKKIDPLQVVFRHRVLALGHRHIIVSHWTDCVREGL